MRLNILQAEELVEVHLFGMGELENAGTFGATVFDAAVSDVRASIDAFIESLGITDFDHDSITITPDHIDDMDVPCVAVTIKLEAS